MYRDFFLFFRKFWLGGAAPQTPRFLAGGAKPPQTLPLNGRSSHLIEAAKRGRLDQMLLFFSGAADDTGAADDRLAGRPAGRSAGRTPGPTPAVTPGRTSPQTLTKNLFTDLNFGRNR